MRMNPNEKFFVFISPDITDVNAAQKLLEAAEGIEIVDIINNTFRIRTTQSSADAFKAAHDKWIVTLEHWVPKPGIPRPRVIKGPE